MTSPTPFDYSRLTPLRALVRDAREWALKFPWQLDDTDMVGLPAEDVLDGIAEFYDGGIEQFARDRRHGPEVLAAIDQAYADDDARLDER